MNEPRYLHLRNALGAVRTEHYDGREHLVVPVVALMDGVIHAVNASTPERVTVSTLAKAANSWNGRPLVLGHPTKGGRQCSANDPAIEASHRFGTIFNSRMSGQKLLMDAYVDPVRAEKLGGADFVRKLRDGEQCEVSVGAFVTTDNEAGHHNGKAYKATWLETAGDHLAFLPKGIGACSIEMGCGAHRAATHFVTAEGMEADVEKGLKDRALSFLRSLMPRGWGDDEVKQELREALYEIEPNARNGDIVRVTNDSVIYCIYPQLLSSEVYPNAYPVPKISHWKRGYIFDTALQKFVVSTERTPVEPTTHYEPMRGAANPYHDEKGQFSSGPGGGDRDQDPGPRPLTGIHVPPGDHVTYINSKSGEEKLTFVTVKDHGDRVSVKSEDDDATASVRIISKKNLTYVYPEARRRALRAAKEDCPSCQGSGNVDGNPCEACDGVGEMKAAEVIDPKLKAACRCEEADVTKAERIAALLKHEHNPVKSQKALEVLEEAELTALEVGCGNLKTAGKIAEDLKAAQDKAAADLKAAADKQAETDAALKVAQAAQIPAEELTELRALATAKKAADAAQKATLVASLKVAAKGVYTDEELDAKPIAELLKLAQVAKVEAPADYSGRGVPMPRVAADAYVAPDPYEAGIKALQARVN